MAIGGSSGRDSGTASLLEVACVIGGSTVDDDSFLRSIALLSGGNDSVSSMLTLEFLRD